MRPKFVSFIHARSTRAEIRKMKKSACGTRFSRNSRSNHYDGQRFTLDALFPVPASLIFSDRIGMPENMKGGIDVRVREETGFYNIEDWLRHNWGMIDDVFDVHVREGDQNYWMVKFTTWDCPPTHIIHELSEAYPKIKFHHRYFAVDAPIAGDALYQHGVPTAENRYVGCAYDHLIENLKRQGVDIQQSSGELLVEWNPQPMCDSDIFSAVFDASFQGGALTELPSANFGTLAEIPSTEPLTHLLVEGNRGIFFIG